MVSWRGRIRRIGAIVGAFVAAISWPAESADHVVRFRNDLTAAERLLVRRLPELRGDKAELTAAFAGKNVWMADVALRDDAKGEKLVLLQTGYWCGSVGCQLLLLEREGRYWQIVTSLNFELGNRPLRILPDSDSGWRRLAWGDQVYIWRACGYWTRDILDRPEFNPQKMCD
jgi:hypothetical protein